MQEVDDVDSEGNVYEECKSHEDVMEPLET